MGLQQREKGKRYERWVRAQFATVFSTARRTGWQQSDGGDVADVVAGPFAIECKSGRRAANPLAALRQAEQHCPAGAWAIAVCSLDRQPATVTMRLDDFLDLVREWQERAR